MSKVKEMNPAMEAQPEQQQVSLQQMEAMMQKDMSMIRLRANVLELKAIKFKLISEMLETKVGEELLINNTDLRAKAQEDVNALLESIMEITA